ncbi:MAG: hypothetical protein ACREID_06525, partial [Planctomycetota bacterium]
MRGPPRRLAPWIAILCLALGGLAWFLATRQGMPARARAPSRAPPEGEVAVPAPGAPPSVSAPVADASPFATALASLGRALQSGGGASAQDAAAELRRLLRLDDAALGEARASLLDHDTPAEWRMALALVLGTL